MFVRYRDLKERGIFRNRQTLKNRIDAGDFPPGRLLGANDRAWCWETEIQPWLDSRPTGKKPLPPCRPGKRRGRPRKAETANVEA